MSQNLPLFHNQPVPPLRAGSGGGADPASSRQSEEVSRLQELFGGSPEQRHFTGEFLAALPLSRLETIISQVQSSIGRLLRVTGSSSPYTLLMSGETASVAISLAADGKVRGLRILGINPASQSLQETLASLGELPGSFSYLVTRNGHPLAARAPDEALRGRYLTADAEERRRLLAELCGELPEAGLFSGKPVAPQIEWFMSVRQLVNLIREVQGLIGSLLSGESDPDGRPEEAE